MCLGIPGYTLEITGMTARVDVTGTKKAARETLQIISDLVGDFSKDSKIQNP